MSTTNKNKKSISETLLEMDELTKAIKRARFMALMPYIDD